MFHCQSGESQGVLIRILGINPVSRVQEGKCERAFESVP